MKVHWTRTAENHLEALHHHISQDSPDYAKRIVDRLTSRSKQIADFPSSGRKVPEFNVDQIREVIDGSFRIIYRISPTQIDVLAVIHGAMNLTSRD